MTQVKKLDDFRRETSEKSRREEYMRRRARERFFHFSMNRKTDATYIAALERLMSEKTLPQIMRDLLDQTGETTQ